MWLRRREYDALRDELRRVTADRDLFSAAMDARSEAVIAEIERRHELEVKNAVLTERLDLLTTFSNPQPSNFVGSQGSNEEVEDIEYAYRNGQLNASDYEDALAAAGFQNTTIEFPSGNSYRL